MNQTIKKLPNGDFQVVYQKPKNEVNSILKNISIFFYASFIISLPILLITYLLTLILKPNFMETINQLFENNIAIIFLICLILLLLIITAIIRKTPLDEIDVTDPQIIEPTDIQIARNLLKELYKLEKNRVYTTARLMNLTPGSTKHDIKEFSEKYKELGVLKIDYTMENGKFTGSGFCLTEMGRDYVNELFFK